MKNRIVIGVVAMSMAAVLILQGCWLYHSWTLTVTALEEQTGDILRRAVEIHLDQRMKTLPRGTKVDATVRHRDVPELTWRIEGMAELGCPVDLQQTDLIVHPLLQEAGITGRHRIVCEGDTAHVPTDGIRSDILYTKADRSAGIRLYVETPFAGILGRMKLIFLITLPIVAVALAGWAWLLRRTLTRKKLDRLKEDYSYALSHDLRTPLCSLKSGTDLLGMEKVYAVRVKREEYLSILRFNIDAIQETVDRVLDSYALELGEWKTRKEETPLQPLADELKEAFTAFSYGRVTFVIHLGTPVVYAQKELLRSVLYNLIDNSLKYNDKPVEIRLTSASESRYDILRVRDNGRGIPTADRRKIFRKFERASALQRSRKGGASGFGLGLYFVKQVMDAHGGRVTVDSVVGEWTEFSLYFPRGQ